MKAWITSQRDWLVVEPLPGYGHDLNPVELIWGNLKSSELANLCPDTIKEAVGFAEGGLDRIGTDPERASPSCGTAVSSCDEHVTARYEPL